MSMIFIFSTFFLRSDMKIFYHIGFVDVQGKSQENTKLEEGYLLCAWRIRLLRSERLFTKSAQEM